MNATSAEDLNILIRLSSSFPHQEAPKHCNPYSRDPPNNVPLISSTRVLVKVPRTSPKCGPLGKE